jgi:hypothetical protein
VFPGITFIRYVHSQIVKRLDNQIISVGEISTKWPIQDRTVTVSEITMRVHQVYTRSQRFGSNINQRAYTGGSKYSKLKWYKMNLFKDGVDVLKLAIDGIFYRQDNKPPCPGSDHRL